MKEKKPLLVIAAVFLFVIVGAIVSSFIIRGYRPDFKNGGILATGLLAATSKPEGASVYINDKLVTATDDTINLKPGKYKVKILKDGFLPWEKEIVIKKEVVKQTDAYLFRSAPDLKPLTTTGAINPTLSPDGYKIVYAVASASAQTKNGVWVAELSSGLPLGHSSKKQIARSTALIDWAKFQFRFSPDSSQVLAILKKDDQVASAYLLEADKLNPQEQLRDVSFQLEFILQEWGLEQQKAWQRKIQKLPEEIQRIATSSAILIAFSPNEEKLLYLATGKDQIKKNLLPHPPARSDQKESRNLSPGVFYVYDLKEDTNFAVVDAQKLGIDWKNLKLTPKTLPTFQLTPTPTTPSPTLSPQPSFVPTVEEYLPIFWLATSRHLVFVEEEKIKVIEADGTNKQTLYAGPFVDSILFPWPDGKRVVILTSLHTDLPPNLYELTIH